MKDFAKATDLNRLPLVLRQREVVSHEDGFDGVYDDRLDLWVLPSGAPAILAMDEMCQTRITRTLEGVDESESVASVSLRSHNYLQH